MVWDQRRAQIVGYQRSLCTPGNAPCCPNGGGAIGPREAEGHLPERGQICLAQVLTQVLAQDDCQRLGVRSGMSQLWIG